MRSFLEGWSCERSIVLVVLRTIGEDTVVLIVTDGSEGTIRFEVEVGFGLSFAVGLGADFAQEDDVEPGIVLCRVPLLDQPDQLL